MIKAAYGRSSNASRQSRKLPAMWRYSSQDSSTDRPLQVLSSNSCLHQFIAWLGLRHTCRTMAAPLLNILLQEPSILDAAGRPWLKFGKVTTPGQSKQLPINVRNNGFLTATARIEMEPHPAFRLLQGTQVSTHMLELD